MILRRPERWILLGGLAALLALWEWAARTGNISALFFPPPTNVIARLGHLIQNGVLAGHLGATLSRISAGLVLGGAAGLLLGWRLGTWQQLKAVVDPLIAAVHPIPKISVLPLVMIVLGIGEASKVAVVALACFFPVVINTMAGVSQIHPVHFEVARNYGARRWQLLARVVLPSSLPLVLAGFRLALNTALLLSIAVELVAAQTGLGAMIWLAWQTLRTEELYAAILVTSLLGIGFNLVLQALSRWWVPWQDRA